MLPDLPPSSPGTARTAQPSAPPPPLESGPSLVWPVALLGALAAAALVLTRRRRRLGQWVKVLETTSLGPKRSLVVAQLGGETVLLASSEAGITLLKSGLQRAPAEQLAPAPPGLHPRATAPFEELLGQSVEDQELRRKLAAGHSARAS